MHVLNISRSYDSLFYGPAAPLLSLAGCGLISKALLRRMQLSPMQSAPITL